MSKSHYHKIPKCILLIIVIITSSTTNIQPIYATTTTPPLTPKELGEIQLAGTYPVEINYTNNQTGQMVTDIIYVTIYHQRTVANPDVDEAIDAHDIEIQVGYFDKLSDQDLIYLTNARAWYTSNGRSIAISTINRNTQNAAIGRYQLTLATVNGTATTVNVIERTEVLINNQEQYFSFQNFSYIYYFELIIIATILTPFIAMLLIYFKIKKNVDSTDDLLFEK